MPACRNPHAATCCQEFLATNATRILRNERYGFLRCERCVLSPHPVPLPLAIGHGLKERECSVISPHPGLLPLAIGHGLEEKGRFDQIVLQKINLITSNFVRFGAHGRSVEILCKLCGGGSSASWRISEVCGGE